MKRVRLFSLVLLAAMAITQGMGQTIERIEPPSWFSGMNERSLQLMVYGKEIGSFDMKADYPGVEVKTVIKTDNPNYLFVNLDISPEALPGTIKLIFTRGKMSINQEYPLLEKPSGKARGFDGSDVIYLLMPDRFANGDPSNDNVEGMAERNNRSNPGGLHGGDLKGIGNSLGYLKNLGVTGIWLNPFLENNQPSYSYHGYSTTDFYRVDPRYGTNDEFRQLVADVHDRGMKVVMDMIFNHCGSGHWWMKDLPARDWIHQFDRFTRTNYKASTYMDPYAAESDRNLMEEGWFDVTMPDLNQGNPLVENYLTQNSLWWIAWAGIDGIRMDTYPYPEPGMMSRWVKRVTDEFPGFFVVGEVWYDDPAHMSYWALNKENSDGYRSNLPSLTDLPLCFSTHRAFTLPGANEGMTDLYNLLSQDFLYPEPHRNVIFLDNHDMTRFFTETGKSLDNYKMGLSFILTTRGIPQIYYGTEIIMEGDKKRGDGYLREDFPGGWPGDIKNAFTGENLTPDEKQAHEFTRNLLNWRKGNGVIHTGKLKHYVPENGVYVYFRYDSQESVMVIINRSDEKKKLMTGRFAESLNGYTSGTEITTGKVIADLSSIELSPRTAMIIELKK